ncbi:MAG: calcium/sodium antiporter [Acidimicrobiales bacterium]|nr:calcium/sodium antiporter [Hyphomonadaceae bacterium]RZV38754.1 MAG: calcium/sodium antiporter [Acidimicrobiales bacterium]
MSPIVINFLLLVLGVLLLLWAGDWLVRGAASLARKWGVPALIVGLTIVAFGTSAPELVVSVQAVLRGASELAIGNVIGSNIANVLLVLGAPAIIMAIPTNVSGVARNSFAALAATLILMGLMFIHRPLVMWQGAILFLGIVLYLSWMFSLAKSGADDPALVDMAEIDEMSGMPSKMGVIVGFILFGIFGLAFGGHLIVENATQIAQAFNVSEAVIGLTIVAIGTSLPELATVIVAAYRGQTDVAIGNVLGSNIFNIFAVMGAAALTGAVHIPPKFMVFDIWVMLAAMVALTVFILRRMPISRPIGIVFLLGYILYMAAISREFVGAGLPA